MDTEDGPESVKVPTVGAMLQATPFSVNAVRNRIRRVVPSRCKAELFTLPPERCCSYIDRWSALHWHRFGEIRAVQDVETFWPFAKAKPKVHVGMVVVPVL